MRSNLFILLTAVISFFLLNHCFLQNYYSLSGNQPSAVTISAVGDLMCHSPQFEYARTENGGYDFKTAFFYVKEIIGKADLAAANFETTLGGRERKFSGYPAFNSPDEFLEAVRYAGFDFLFTSNNHSYDRGKGGVLRTLEKIKGCGLNSAGTNFSKQKDDSAGIVTIKGIKIGFLSYTQHLNGFSLPKGFEYLVNLLDTAKVRKDIRKLKDKGADLVIVYFHFGNEYERNPGAFQKTIVRKAVLSGADIILASHPHVIQKIETFKPINSKLDTGFVAYSLGNFISNQRWRYSDAGVILNFKIEKNISGVLELKMINIVPTWVFKDRLFLKNEFAVIPSEEAFSTVPFPFLTAAHLRQMKESFYDTKESMLENLKLSKSKISCGRNFSY